jgi:hypothetical protein
MLQYLASLFRWLFVLPMPSIEALIERDLEEARRDLLKASKERENWASSEAMYRCRVDRLQALLLERPKGGTITGSWKGLTKEQRDWAALDSLAGVHHGPATPTNAPVVSPPKQP